MKNIFSIFKRKKVETPYKEVKRKAKKGEWVKITNPLCGIALHYKDDIVRIIDHAERFHNHKKIVGLQTGCLCTVEYVVLEGYNGEDKV